MRKYGINCEFFGVEGKGVVGYLRQLPAIRSAIRVYQPDIIHAHYGLCGLLANFQRKVPVVTTYHGSDINEPGVLRLSRRSIQLSQFNIFVSQENVDLAQPVANFALIPCGVTLNEFPFVEKDAARNILGLRTDKKYVLFAGAFDNHVKNAPLAKAAMRFVPEAELLELKGYSRSQVAILMYAVDAFLMTSFTEGSPQVIKEAMTCGCPIVSVDVGDVKEQILGLCGCYLVERNAELISEQLIKAINYPGRTEGRKRIVERQLTNDLIAGKLVKVYKMVQR